MGSAWAETFAGGQERSLGRTKQGGFSEKETGFCAGKLGLKFWLRFNWLGNLEYIP